MNRVVEILMKRDGITQAEAESLVEDTRDELLEAIGTCCVETDEIIMNNLGLETDYLEDILEV